MMSELTPSLSNLLFKISVLFKNLNLVRLFCNYEFYFLYFHAVYFNIYNNTSTNCIQSKKLTNFNLSVLSIQANYTLLYYVIKGKWYNIISALESLE